MRLPDQWQRLGYPNEGEAVSFTFSCGNSEEEGFLICYKSEFYAYRNRCPHAGTTLDWLPGRFFSEDGELLVCQTHGAHFSPDSGEPVLGPSPCGLDRLPVRMINTVVEVPKQYAEPPWSTTA